MNTLEYTVLDTISTIIRHKIQDLDAECHNPGSSDSDRSDDFIANLRRDVDDLRRIRNELESIFYREGAAP